MILNKSIHKIPFGSVYIGRGSPYGNPFKIGSDGDRGQVISKFESWVRGKPELMKKIKEELRGKDLVCFCAPAYCHGEILEEIANE